MISTSLILRFFVIMKAESQQKHFKYTKQKGNCYETNQAN